MSDLKASTALPGGEEIEERRLEAHSLVQRGDLRGAELALVQAIALGRSSEATIAGERVGEILGELGDIHAQQKDFRAAINSYKDSLLAAADSPFAQARAHRRLGTVFREQGDDERASESLSDAERLLSQCTDLETTQLDAELAEIALQAGALSAHSAMYSEAVASFRSAERRFDNVGDLDGVARSLRATASALKEQGLLGDAAAELERATALVDDDEDIADRIEFHNLIGMVALEDNEFHNALESFGEARRLAGPINHPLLIDTLRGLGMVRDARGEFEEARRVYEDAINRASDFNDQVRLSTLLCELGEIHEQQARFAEAIKYYNRALALDQAHQDSLGIAAALRRLGSAWLERGEFERAEELFEQAETILRQGEDADELAQLYVARGELAEEECLFADALEWYDRAQGLYERGGTSADHANCHRHRASALIRQHRYREAESELSNALSLAPAANEFEQIVMKNLLGEVRSAQGRIDDALRLFRDALRLADRFGHSESKGETLRRLGAACAAAGDYSAAAAHYDAAEEIFANDEIAQLELACQQGELAEMRGALDEALERFRSAHQRARRLDHRGHNVRALLGLGRIYRDRRNLDRAADYLEEASSLASVFQGGATKARVQVELGLLRELEGRYEECISLYNDALALLEQQESQAPIREVHRHLLRAFSASERDLSAAYEHLIACSTLDTALLAPGFALMLRMFDHRLHQVISLFASGSYESAVRDAFVICERELRARWERGHPRARSGRPATEVIEAWFSAENRGILPWLDEGAFGAFRRFARSAFEAGRNPTAHGAMSITDPVVAFTWVGVINMILLHLDAPEGASA